MPATAAIVVMAVMAAAAASATVVDMTNSTEFREAEPENTCRQLDVA